MLFGYRNVYIGQEKQIACLDRELKNQLVAPLNKYNDVFARSYADMPGINTTIVIHRLPLELGYRPAK